MTSRFQEPKDQPDARATGISSKQPSALRRRVTERAHDMASATDDAHTAILNAITRTTADLPTMSPDKQAEALKNLAAAYRFTVGGQQPGGSAT